VLKPKWWLKPTKNIRKSRHCISLARSWINQNSSRHSWDSCDWLQSASVPGSRKFLLFFSCWKICTGHCFRPR
jgi:hypothetical protein